MSKGKWQNIIENEKKYCKGNENKQKEIMNSTTQQNKDRNGENNETRNKEKDFGAERKAKHEKK